MGVVHQGNLWGRAGLSIPRLPFDYAQGKLRVNFDFAPFDYAQGKLRVNSGNTQGKRSAQGLFVCDKFIGEPAPTGDQPGSGIIYQKI